MLKLNFNLFEMLPKDSLSNCTSAEETKMLEARARLQQDLEKVNRQIQRLIDPNSAEGRPHSKQFHTIV